MDHSETEFENSLIKIKKIIFVDLLTFDCATTQGGATASFSSAAVSYCNTGIQGKGHVFKVKAVL